MIACFLVVLLSGCNSLEPLTDAKKEETNSTLNVLSGTYRIIDSRQNKYSAIIGLNATLSTEKGRVRATTNSGKPFGFKLFNCRVANHIQTKNSGEPIESVEKLIRCDMVSDYKYAEIYIGKVKNDYTVKDQKLFKSFEPIIITGGYLIVIKDGVNPIFLNATKE